MATDTDQLREDELLTLAEASADDQAWDYPGATDTRPLSPTQPRTNAQGRQLRTR